MNEVLTVDKTYGDALCAWCEAPFTKTSINKLYCSKDCAREQRASIRRYQPKPEVIKIGPNYHDYEERQRDLIEKYGVVVKEQKGGSGHTYQVPDLGFKRYKESKNILILTSRRERKRSQWL